ncbi:MAG TPA: hypothetical protein VN904_02385 [Chthoniobacterales bacterium]|jgi:hypothetical protein|nr:hypothetical protein [Chthoniobacterales bacterium]
MKACPSGIGFAKPATFLSALILFRFVTPVSCLADANATNDQGGYTKNRAQVECITPDGRLSPVSSTTSVDRQAPASIIDDQTISCSLREGETTFLIALPKGAPHDRFTFVNENAAACGEFRIAVSNSPLPADSAKWVEVDGIVPFAHKRLFNLSMLGVETRFVRLSFHVEHSGQEVADRSARDAARILNTFRASALSEAINSNFAKRHDQRQDVAISFTSLSVAPLPSRPNE